MAKTVIVYGPAGCGKTRNSEVLRHYFDCDGVVDQGGAERVNIHDGYLHLCIVKPKIVKTDWIVMDYQSAMNLSVPA